MTKASATKIWAFMILMKKLGFLPGYLCGTHVKRSICNDCIITIGIIVFGQAKMIVGQKSIDKLCDQTSYLSSRCVSWRQGPSMTYLEFY